MAIRKLVREITSLEAISPTTPQIYIYFNELQIMYIEPGRNCQLKYYHYSISFNNLPKNVSAGIGCSSHLWFGVEDAIP
jgi:hypothetical protein